jgi:tRNA/rRNA methyltransferase
MTTPSILLVRPQMGENIGAAARAMANFGLRELRLVAPRDGWPNPKASDTAGKALNIIDDAAVHESVGDALADCQFVLATTARERAMSLPVMDVREAMAQLHARAARGEKCAVMFGPERTGLENEDMALANAVVTIPVSPEYSSLNVGQAVVVCAYEWFQAVMRTQSLEFGQVCSGEKPSPRGGEGLDEGGWGGNALQHVPSPNPLPVGERVATLPSPASRAHLLGLFDQLEAALDDVNFWRVPEKKEIMWRNIRAGLTRAGLTEQEIATWRGVIKALTNH